MKNTKKCFKCGIEKSLTEFYKHPKMADGHLGKCKECTKKDIHKSSRNIKRKCVICGNEFGTCMSEINSGGGLCCSRNCYYVRLRKIVKKEENSSSWKGDSISKGRLHAWVKKHLGKPNLCEHCRSTTAKKFEWANKSGEYKRDLTDWIRLCTKCHAIYDNLKEKRKKTLTERYGWKFKTKPLNKK